MSVYRIEMVITASDVGSADMSRAAAWSVVTVSFTVDATDVVRALTETPAAFGSTVTCYDMSEHGTCPQHGPLCTGQIVPSACSLWREATPRLLEHWRRAADGWEHIYSSQDRGAA